jgi:glycosyltransferase involved in cell wall biosynthesis
MDLGVNLGGFQSHVLGITKGLHKLGWDVVLFSGDCGNEQPDVDFKQVLVKNKPGSLLGVLLYQFRLMFALLKTRGRPDAVYIRTNYSQIVPVLYALINGIPYYYEINGIQSLETGKPLLAKIAEKVENFFMRRASGIFTVTSELKEYLQKRTGVSASKFCVVANGADIDMCAEESSSSEESEFLKVGFMGAFQERQGIETFLKTLPLVKSEISNVKYVVAGRGADEEKYKVLVKELGVSESVDFAGFVTRDRLGSVLSTFDVSVAPYTAAFGSGETGLSPLKIFTYLVCERVCVISELGSLENFRVCPAVFFAKPDEVESFAGEILKVLKMGKDERLQLGRVGREFVLGNYTWDHSALKTSKFIVSTSGKNR